MGAAWDNSALWQALGVAGLKCYYRGIDFAHARRRFPDEQSLAFNNHMHVTQSESTHNCVASDSHLP